MVCVEEQDASIGSERWIASMGAILDAGLARLQEVPPSPPPLEAASHAAIRRLVEIERELGKGPAASPVVVANVGRLRKVYHERLMALARLSDALCARAEDDNFFNWLGTFDTHETAKAPHEPVPAEKGNLEAQSPSQDFAAADALVSPPQESDPPAVLPEHMPGRAGALNELRLAAKLIAGTPLTALEQAEFDAETRMQSQVLNALIGDVEIPGAASRQTGTALLQVGNKVDATDAIAKATSEPDALLSEDETPITKTSQSNDRLSEARPSAEAKKRTKPAGIEAKLNDEIKRLAELRGLETAWSTASPQARGQFQARLMIQALDQDRR